MSDPHGSDDAEPAVLARIPRHLTCDPELDWSIFADPARSGFVAGLDQSVLRRSSTLQRVVDLAASLAGSRFSQISLVGDSQLVPAAHGLGELDSAQRSPVDDSLCSVTMALGEWLVIGDARTHHLVRDLLPVRSGMVGSYLGIPMRTSSGHIVGALCVYDSDESSWPTDLASTLEDLVVFAMNEIELIASVEAGASSVRQLTAVIQQIVAPADVAPPPGVEITGRFRSADVGGDWYDWILLGDRLALTIGDVAGHGLQAVATMATLKAYVRSYVVEGHDPTQTLERTSKVFDMSCSNDMATVLDARYAPSTRVLTYASAGHPPPLVVREGRAFFANLDPGPPVGFGRVGASEHRVELRPDDIVVFYTDGLFEERRVVADHSLEALRAEAERVAGVTRSLDEFADALIATTISDTDDDACLIALRA